MTDNDIGVVVQQLFESRQLKDMKNKRPTINMFYAQMQN